LITRKRGENFFSPQNPTEEKKCAWGGRTEGHNFFFKQEGYYPVLLLDKKKAGKGRGGRLVSSVVISEKEKEKGKRGPMRLYL